MCVVMHKKRRCSRVVLSNHGQPKGFTLFAALAKSLENLSDRPIMTIFDVNAIMELGTNHGIDIER